MQGTVDTLFTLDEGIANYQAVRRNGVPVSMLWFCGGHGLCLTQQGDPQAVQDAAISWLDRWVKRDTSVSTGPAVDVIDQNGVRYAATQYPLPTSAALMAEGRGNLPLVATGGSGPVTVPPGSPATSNPLALGGRPDPAGESHDGGRRRDPFTSAQLARSGAADSHPHLPGHDAARDATRRGSSLSWWTIRPVRRSETR